MSLVPLSLAQRRLWYMAQLHPGNPFYNVTIASRLAFAVDVEALGRALRELVQRHEILRTRYPVVEGVPLQEILPAGDWAMRHTVAPLPEPEARSRKIERFARALARLDLCLETGPVFHAHLLSVAPEEHALVLVTHHIAVDQTSINRMMHELDRIYEAFAAGREPDLPPPRQYREFVVWEAERLRARQAELQAFWDRRLAQAPRPLPLPYDRTPPMNPARRGREQRFRVPDAGAEALRALCRRHHATPFMGLLALWGALLHRYTGEPALFVGTTTAFRERHEFASSLGCFINTLAVRLEVNAERTFEELLLQVRGEVLEAFAHHGFSYEHLVERLRTLHPGSPAPVNAYLQFQPRAMTAPRAATGRFSPNLNVHNGRAKFDLMLNVSDRAAGLDATIEYDGELFSPRTIQAVRADFLKLLAAGAREPGREIGSVPLRLPETRRPPAPPAPDPLPEALGQTGLTPEERRLADLWRELLLVEPSGVDDDFVAHGGHSLLLAQLAWRIRETFGVNVRLGELVRTTRLGPMARLVAASPRGRSAPAHRPGLDLQVFGGLPCQLELGTWSLEDLERLIAATADLGADAPGRVSRAAWALRGTPFQFESRRPLPMTGRLPVRFGAFDCITFVYTALALAAARDFADFVRKLHEIRYHAPESRRIDSDPQAGNVFDFGEESLLVQAVERGFLRDVTAEVAAGADLEEIETRLHPVQRGAAFDPLELWATPKLAGLTIRALALPVQSFGCLEPPTFLRSGDLLLMSRGGSPGGQIVDHVGIAHVEPEGSYLLQATRHFAWRPKATPATPGAYTGIFYDARHKREQIGVGIAGPYAGDERTIEIDGLPYFGYVAEERRGLRDYLAGAFQKVIVLRPSFLQPAPAPPE